MTSQLEQHVSDFRTWREQLALAIAAYRAWLEQSDYADTHQTGRIGDLLEKLQRDQLVLAFVAEFSRGKTELINALFFSGFKQRLLPSDVGRTTMCPTEIFCDSETAPYLRLLPIETRLREESIETLKGMPLQWKRIELNLDTPEVTLAAMQNLAQAKTVSVEEAHSLGLWDEHDPALREVLRDGDNIEIPAWRYAMINYPHPLLKDGLVILDTPGLNALGTEPELTLSIIPNAHAVLFLLATDTGVTRSDLEIWDKYVQKYVNYRVAVLNKIDVLWDELKTWDQIQATMQRQLENTAKQLRLEQSNVLAVSAQKALVAKIRGDAALLEKSGIAALENLLAAEIIPFKKEILRHSVFEEIGDMIGISRQALHSQLASVAHELRELTSLTGKNWEVVEKLRNEVLEDKIKYEETVNNFTVTREKLSQQGAMLMSQLSEERLERILDANWVSIRGRLTTGGLMRGIQRLFDEIALEFDKIHTFSLRLKPVLGVAYRRFHEQYGFDQLEQPALNLVPHRERLEELVRLTDEFCRDPVNLMTEKHMLVNKFYTSLVAEARLVFRQAYKDSTVWLSRALDPLMLRIREHKDHFERRLANIKKIHDNIDTLQERLSWLQGEQARLQAQNATLTEIASSLGIE